MRLDRYIRLTESTSYVKEVDSYYTCARAHTNTHAQKKIFLVQNWWGSTESSEELASEGCLDKKMHRADEESNGAVNGN